MTYSQSRFGGMAEMGRQQYETKTVPRRDMSDRRGLVYDDKATNLLTLGAGGLGVGGGAYLYSTARDPSKKIKALRARSERAKSGVQAAVDAHQQSLNDIESAKYRHSALKPLHDNVHSVTDHKTRQAHAAAFNDEYALHFDGKRPMGPRGGGSAPIMHGLVQDVSAAQERATQAKRNIGRAEADRAKALARAKKKTKVLRQAHANRRTMGLAAAGAGALAGLAGIAGASAAPPPGMATRRPAREDQSALIAQLNGPVGKAEAPVKDAPKPTSRSAAKLVSRWKAPAAAAAAATGGVVYVVRNRREVMEGL